MRRSSLASAAGYRARSSSSGSGKGATLGSYGVPSGTSLAAEPSSPPAGWSSGGTVSKWLIGDNVTVNGYDFTSAGSLTKSVLAVLGTNVLIKNCRFRGDANRAIDTFNAAGVVNIQDCTFIDNFDDAAVSGDNFVVDRCDFYGMGNDGLKMGDNTVLRNSYIHSFNTVPGGHGDGIQGVDTPHGVTVTNTVIDIGVGGPSGELPNSAVIITPWTIVESGPANNNTSTILFQNCTFGGGGLTFHVDLGFTNGIWVKDCKFLSDYTIGPIFHHDGATPIDPPATFTGNVRSDGVTPIAWFDDDA